MTRLLHRFRRTTARAKPGAQSAAGDSAVRRLRVELAEALATQGRGRTREAINELDAALQEPGEHPTNAEIHFIVGRLSRTHDPLQALRRYLLALEGAEPHDLVAGEALSLIDNEPEGELSVALLPDEEVQRLADRARATLGAPVCLLAARVLRLRGDEESALEILRLSADHAHHADPELVRQIALLLLDLRRLDELFELVDNRVDDEKFRIVSMRGHLLDGNFARVIALADQGVGARVETPKAIALRALALTGQGSWTDANELLQTHDGPWIHAARVVVSLVGREYQEAQLAATDFLLASPSDPSALILDAQVKLEGLGEQAASESDLTNSTSGEQFETGLGLLEAALSRLDIDPGGLWWLQVQEAIRNHDGRYQFFKAHLRLSRGEVLGEEDLGAIDLGMTSYVQDAVIYEAQADIARKEGSTEKAAQAYSRASQAWQYDEVADGQRAHRCSEAAYELEPTGVRAAELAFAVVFDSYRAQNLESLSRDLGTTCDLLLPWVQRSTGIELRDLTRAVAWLLGRQFEVAPRDKVRLGTRAVPWLIVASRLVPEDAALHGLLAAALRSVGHHDAALFFAAEGLKVERNSFTVSTMATCRLDRAEFGEVMKLVDDPVLESEGSWCAALRLVTRLVSGDVDSIPATTDDTIGGPNWIAGYAAMVRCLRGGLAAGQSRMSAALDDVEVSEVGYHEIVLAAVNGRTDLKDLSDSAGESGNLTTRQMNMAKALVTWFTDPGMSFDSLAHAILNVAPSPFDVEQFIHADGPLLIAAKGGEDVPLPVIAPEDALAECRERLDGEANAWQERLDEISVGLSSVLSVATAVTTADVAAWGQRALAAFSDPDLRHVVSEVVEAATAEALGRLVRHQIAWRLGKADPDSAGVQMSLQPEYGISPGQQIAVLVVADGYEESLRELIQSSTPEDLAEALSLVQDAATTLVADAEEFWTLFDNLNPALAAAGTDELLQRIRGSLLLVLGQILELPNEPPVSRSHFSFVLGRDFIPEDTGPDWSLFADIVPAMKARVKSKSGFTMPGCFVRGDYTERDALWILTNGALREAHRLPTRGWIVRCEPGQELCRDPLTGEHVAVSHVDERPAGAFSPLEFAMRWVESFVFRHRVDLFTIWDLAMLIDEHDPESNRLVADPMLFVAAMDLVREAGRGEGIIDYPQLALSLRRLANQPNRDLALAQ
jgi:hypothetical protein